MGRELGRGLRFGVLGPLQAVHDGEPVVLKGQRQRELLALLLLHADELVRIDQLSEALFGERHTDNAANAVRVAVSRLRRVLGHGELEEVIRTHPGGYVLTTKPHELDLAQFEGLLRDARGCLAADDPAAAATLLREALALWRGPPLADLALVDSFQGEIRRLEHLRELALIERIRADLALGGGAELVPEIETLVASVPLQERLRGQLMLALYRAGRQADALATYREACLLMREQLGLQPGPELRALEQSILRRDPELDPGRRGALGSLAVVPEPAAQAGVAALSNTRYAKSGETHIAYQVLSGSGAIDLVVIPPAVTNLEILWEHPLVARFLQALGSFSRMAIFDVRGTGMSDRSIGHPTLEERMDDARAVMDAVGMERAAIVGYSHGGPMAMTFAATYPERTSAIVLFGTFARLLNGPDFRLGHSREQVDRFVERWAASWGTLQTFSVASYCPSMSGDEGFLRWLSRLERQSATPADLRAMVALDCEIDVRRVLPAIRVPALVIHRVGDRVNRVEQARWMAAQIPGAQYVELPGDDHLPYVGDQDSVVEAIRGFLTGLTPEEPPDRVLATVMFTKLASPAGHIAVPDDGHTSEGVTNAYSRVLGRYSGRPITVTPDGLIAAFDSPARSIRCSAAMVASLQALGLEASVGVHTGECERRGDDIFGIAVDVAARMAALAAPGEVVVSRTVKDLIAGSGIRLADYGEHELPGIVEPWRIHGVSDVATPS